MYSYLAQNYVKNKSQTWLRNTFFYVKNNNKVINYTLFTIYVAMSIPYIFVHAIIHRQGGEREATYINMSMHVQVHVGVPGGASGKEATCQCRRHQRSGFDPWVSQQISGLGRSHGGGHGNLLQYSCLENPMDRGTWWATVHRVTKSWTRLK